MEAHDVPEEEVQREEGTHPSRPRPEIRPGSRWADPARSVAVGVITKCASTYALVLIAHIASRR